MTTTIRESGLRAVLVRALFDELWPDTPGDKIEAAADHVAEAITRAAPIVCPVHGIPDCSPLLNGCSIPNHIAGWRDTMLAPSAPVDGSPDHGGNDG